MKSYFYPSGYIMEVAESLLGIPYELNGRDENGLDCWGLVYMFFKQLGIKLPEDDGGFVDENWYKKDPDRYKRGLSTLGREVGDCHNLKVLDIPYFTLYREVVTHSGVMVNDEEFIHVLNGRKVEFASMKKRLWRRKYAGGICLI
ncbi:MAG: C40 family peptidase [Bacillota bacterium]